MACAVTVLAIALAVALGVANGADPLGKSHLVFVVTCAVAGALVAGSRPRNALGWALLVSAASFALLEAFGEYAVRGAGLAAWPENWLWVPANLGVALVPLLFPDGRPPSRRWWWLLGPVGALALAAAVLGAMRPGASGQVRADATVPNPFGVDGLAPVADAVGVAFTVGAALTFVAGGVVVLRRWRDPQVKWVAWAGAIAAVVVLARLAAGLMDGDPGSPWPRASLFWEGAGAVAISLLPAALTVAVLRHRLYDIDVLITRTLLYGSLSACLIAGYALIAGYLGALLGKDVALPATAAVAVAFAPLRDRLQRGIDVLWHGQKEEPHAVLGRRLQEAAVLPLIAKAVAETMRVRHVTVKVREGGETAFGPLPVGVVPVVLPLAYQGEPVGTLTLWPAIGERLLEDLTRQVGVAVHAVRLSEDLQRSRERLVMAREEERRRLRRDLHDGLGPTLAALTMRAEAAQDAEPEAARKLLEKVADDAEAAMRDVRRLVEGLRPAALDTLGLAGALAAHLSALPTTTSMRLVADDEMTNLPAATEVAAYRIAVEAVTNVCRHSGARSAVVRLSVDEDRLVVEVSDDGHGRTHCVRPGVGLTSMRERAEELGGTLEVTSGTEGTRVRATLPTHEGRR
ncbi:Histidine kinase-, DNA gyrase B-, and HSP90-like ATPase [Paractinoplanes atraurantiacus]|uniref:Histidine kinase-, DNA gyrase B-, and HSP90-like ATPase n=1 Tax=Paractinoplanes atraurantiacus TaxID=1036182 RepID=A0A285K0E3_9ACTN|nr:Histidine kinase-, DNA gyrase B-, and HSP90-like ATPase [Actinoplanes atraurantiacus]